MQEFILMWQLSSPPSPLSHKWDQTWPRRQTAFTGTAWSLTGSRSEAFFLLALMPLKAARQDYTHVWLYKNPLFMLGHNLEDRPLTWDPSIQHHLKPLLTAGNQIIVSRSTPTCRPVGPGAQLPARGSPDWSWVQSKCPKKNSLIFIWNKPADRQMAAGCRGIKGGGGGGGVQLQSGGPTCGPRGAWWWTEVKISGETEFCEVWWWRELPRYSCQTCWQATSVHPLLRHHVSL